MTPLYTVLAFTVAATLVPAMPLAAQQIPVGPQQLMGVAIGTGADAAIADLTAALGAGEDSGWIDGCEVNGIIERYVQWGGLTAAFEEVTETGDAFVGWSYRLDPETGGAVPGGPSPEQIVLPKGIKLGDRFSDAAQVYDFEPLIDDVFGVGLYFGRYFALMTPVDDINGPITEVAVPYFSLCE